MATDRAGIEDLFAYSDWAWRQLFHIAEAAGGDRIWNTPAPGSGWPALRDAFAHILIGYHRWLRDPVSGPPAIPDDADRTLAQIAEHRAQVRAQFRQLLDGTSDAELGRLRDFQIDGEIIPFSRGELLVHLLLHERGHHGDINTLFYQLGIEGDSVEYRFHLMAQRGL